MSKEIEEKIKLIAHEHLGVEKSKINLTSDVENDLGADSLDKVELVMVIEEEFSIEISDDDSDKLHTINDYLILIEKLLA